MCSILITLLLIICISPLQPGHAADAESTIPFSIAFFYAPKPPLDELKAFDIAVVDPDAAGISPVSYNNTKSQLFAYLSVGEADPNRSWFSKLDPAWFISDNPVWKSRVVNTGSREWRDFFLNNVVEPLWASGYRGFFLDTLDSYHLVKDKKRHPELEAGLVETIREIKKRHPEARLIMNRGFEFHGKVKELVFAVAAESLFQNFDPVTGKYGEVAEAGRKWLLERFSEVKKNGLQVISIDYVDPGNRELARKTADKIRKLGFVPWVADKDLGSLGVGTIEVLPRKILGFYDGTEGPDPVYTNIHRLAVMPLNYLGYQVELRNVADPLPSEILAGRYAGVVVWPNADLSGVKSGLLNWVKRQAEQGVPVAFLDRFGFPPELSGELPGLEYRARGDKRRHLTIVRRARSIMLENETLPVAKQYLPLGLKNGEALITIGGEDAREVTAAAITSWGGFVLQPFVTMQAVGNQGDRWLIDPFEFFRRALRLEGVPAPDTTTENGVRLLLSHIDGDGFESRAEWPGGRYAATELRERILDRYRIPTSFSVITSILGDHGLYPVTSPALRVEARAIFALPWVEAASHTFSHPFFWQNFEVSRYGHSLHYLPTPGYEFNLEDEITGSIRFINQNLLRPGKRVTLLQWSGDCTPGADALALAEKSGVATINGGFTVITESNRGYALVAPLGIEKGGYFQVFAPNQNENVYTTHWNGPYYGYRRVIETFRLTDAPRRLKPLNIYYHAYSITKTASLKALEEVYDWALAQKPYPIFASEYVGKVLDFNRTAIARSGDGWLIRNSGNIRQLRLPTASGYPDLEASRGVLGFFDHNDQRYIHLAPGGDSFLKLKDKLPDRPWLSSASARVDSFQWNSRGMRISMSAHSDGSIRFANADGCRLFSKNGALMAEMKGLESSFTLTPGNHELELVCDK